MLNLLIELRVHDRHQVLTRLRQRPVPDPYIVLRILEGHQRRLVVENFWFDTEVKCCI